jgi:hypothetical protein
MLPCLMRFSQLEIAIKLMKNVCVDMELLSRVQDVRLLLQFCRSSEQGEAFSASFLSFVSMLLFCEELQLS